MRETGQQRGQRERIEFYDLRVDEARITLPEHATPRLGPDVVVSGGAMPAPEKDLPLRLQARIDLGPDFRVSGRGLEARAQGQVEAVGGASLDTLRLAGRVDMAGGHYQAFGQRLRLERGLLRFTGLPLDPALDLLATRPTPPGETQRVGVQVTGRAQDPRVRLWSDPALPEAQALSWLAVMLKRSGNDTESQSILQRALAINPQSIDANYYYGELLLEARRPQEAAAYLERVLQAPARPGREISDSGRRDEARALLDAILRNSTAWAVERVQRVSLGGLHPRIFLLRREGED